VNLLVGWVVGATVDFDAASDLAMRKIKRQVNYTHLTINFKTVNYFVEQF
jgi:hypothetical protein